MFLNKLWVCLGVMVMLTGCSQKIEQYQKGEPRADIQAYFNGKIKAWGLIQNWKGEVITKFDVDMVGSWQGDEGTLEEDFRYYNGDTQQRTWKIKKLADNAYEGTASDIIDKATGEQSGDAIRWNYQMDLPVDGRVFRITFDDWMYQMNDGIMINRSYLKKFGITVAELTLFMQKIED